MIWSFLLKLGRKKEKTATSITSNNARKETLLRPLELTPLHQESPIRKKKITIIQSKRHMNLNKLSAIIVRNCATMQPIV